MIAEGSKFLGRTCADCLAYQWGDDGVEGVGKGSRKKYRSVRACYEAGVTPRKRVPGTMPPCFECPKVREHKPKSYYYADEITDQTWQIIQHFDECDAVGQFPENDPIVRRHAAIIRRVREECKRAEHGKGMAYLFSILMMGASGKR